jgi:hypothetical protein
MQTRYDVISCHVSCHVIDDAYRASPVQNRYLPVGYRYLPVQNRFEIGYTGFRYSSIGCCLLTTVQGARCIASLRLASFASQRWQGVL